MKYQEMLRDLINRVERYMPSIDPNANDMYNIHRRRLFSLLIKDQLKHFNRE